MKIVLLGAPGSGKGTQAQLICEEYGLPHISSGDIFRYNISHGTELGKLAKQYIDKGELVPDDITIKMITGRLREEDCAGGYVLDGFPRTISQSEDLARNEDIDVVLELELPYEEVLHRLTGRRSCEKCGAPFHISMLDGKEVCPLCGGRFITRDDDKEETVRKRLDVYDSLTYPLSDYYEKKGVLKRVNGSGDIRAIFEDIKKALSEVGRKKCESASERRKTTDCE